MGYVIRAEKVAKAIEAISKSTDWPANHYRLTLIDMGSRNQPSVPIQNSTDIFIDYTAELTLSGPPIVEPFKKCTELVSACDMAAKFISKLYPSNIAIFHLLL